MDDAALLEIGRSLAGAEPTRLERRGHRALVEAGAYIAWIALDEAGAQEIAREDAVLECLPAPAPVKFPQVVARTAAASLRTRLEGYPALKAHRALLENEMRTRAFAAELAGLAVWLHRLEVPVALPPAAYTDAEVLAGVQAMAAFDPAYGARAAGLLETEQPRLAGAAAEGGAVFLHGDFGSHNLLLDSRGHSFALVDFADARRGDRHYELRWLPSYGELFFSCFVDAYRRASGVSLDAYRVRRLHALVALEQYGWGVREPHEHHRTGRTLEQTRAWVCSALDALDLAD
jgi:aminoglycoside phosphotransferase (APT) family kinase protein